MDLINSFMDFYQWSLTVADPRVANWPLMPSPIPTIVIVAVYMLFIIVIGPKLMSNR